MTVTLEIIRAARKILEAEEVPVEGRMIYHPEHGPISADDLRAIQYLNEIIGDLNASS